jgi:hypothetical protein
MANQSIILANHSIQRPIAPLEQSCYALARQNCRNLATPEADIPCEPTAAPSLPQLNIHFIYTPTYKNGKVGAKRAVQATDDYWSHLIDHVG